jgi:hypothetical protein
MAVLVLWTKGRLPRIKKAYTHGIHGEPESRVAGVPMEREDYFMSVLDTSKHCY